ncbi:MAG: DUF1294 domain-containing protein [Clostridiales bacterium]|jgi:uncharacterized membrane protein YsdA (DUF1294 family)|nr:DUF1294 domain-containing protein [Clostridiales bacterium]
MRLGPFTMYLIIINIVTFILFALDKVKAINGKWRISEFTLLLFSFVGGSLGSLFAMNILRHKVRKIKFNVSIPIMLLGHIAIIVFLVKNGLL